MSNLSMILSFIVNTVCCFVVLETMKGIGYGLGTKETITMMTIMLVVGVTNFFNGASDKTE